MIYNLHGNFACLGLVEGLALGGVKGSPGRFINFSPEGAFQFFVWLICPGEIGVPDEETLSIVIGVYEPAGDVVS